jgi:PIN domain nuclease of toxin-antitoxin system
VIVIDTMFRSDPADELIVATPYAFGCPLLTMDQRMRDDAHVQTI